MIKFVVFGINLKLFNGHHPLSKFNRRQIDDFFPDKKALTFSANYMTSQSVFSWNKYEEPIFWENKKKNISNFRLLNFFTQHAK